MANEGVHRTHCCWDHGCKYGDDDCPVKAGRITQEYPCEWCDEDKEKMERMLHEFFDFDMDSVSRRAFYAGLKARGLKVIEVDSSQPGTVD